MNIITLIAVFGSVMAIVGAVLDIARDDDILPEDLKQREHTLMVQAGAAILGSGLAAFVTEASLDDVEAWRTGEMRPSESQLLQLSVGLAAFNIVQQAEGSRELAELWMTSAETPGDGPIDQLHRGAYERVIESAHRLAVDG